LFGALRYLFGDSKAVVPLVSMGSLDDAVVRHYEAIQEPEVTGLLVIGHGYTAFLDFIVDEPVLAPVVRAAAMTGMRRGEVCGLHWADVDLDRAGSRCVSS